MFACKFNIIFSLFILCVIATVVLSKAPPTSCTVNNTVVYCGNGYCVDDSCECNFSWDNRVDGNGDVVQYCSLPYKEQWGAWFYTEYTLLPAGYAIFTPINGYILYRYHVDKQDGRRVAIAYPTYMCLFGLALARTTVSTGEALWFEYYTTSYYFDFLYGVGYALELCVFILLSTFWMRIVHGVFFAKSMSTSQTIESKSNVFLLVANGVVVFFNAIMFTLYAIFYDDPVKTGKLETVYTLVFGVCSFAIGTFFVVYGVITFRKLKQHMTELEAASPSSSKKVMKLSSVSRFVVVLGVFIMCDVVIAALCVTVLEERNSYPLKRILVFVTEMYFFVVFVLVMGRKKLKGVVCFRVVSQSTISLTTSNNNHS